MLILDVGTDDDGANANEERQAMFVVSKRSNAVSPFQLLCPSVGRMHSQQGFEAMTNGQNEVGKYVDEPQANRKTLEHLQLLIKYFRANEVCPVALGTAARSLRIIVCDSECYLPSNSVFADETPIALFECGFYGIQSDTDLLHVVGFDGGRALTNSLDSEGSLKMQS